jgi:myosin heavy subunit
MAAWQGEVIYAIDGFVEKNKDELSADITAVLEVGLT